MFSKVEAVGHDDDTWPGMEIGFGHAHKAHPLIHTAGDVHYHGRVQAYVADAPLPAAPEALLHESATDAPPPEGRGHTEQANTRPTLRPPPLPCPLWPV